jgi:hypothetical protein
VDVCLRGGRQRFWPLTKLKLGSTRSPSFPSAPTSRIPGQQAAHGHGATRREPRLEHVLAIALEITPRDLVLGTNAEVLLGEWVPRTEFHEESKARSAAQTEAAQLRTELAGARSESASLRSTVEQLSQEVTMVTRGAGGPSSATTFA